MMIPSSTTPHMDHAESCKSSKTRQATHMARTTALRGWRRAMSQGLHVQSNRTASSCEFRSGSSGRVVGNQTHDLATAFPAGNGADEYQGNEHDMHGLSAECDQRAAHARRSRIDPHVVVSDTIVGDGLWLHV